MNNRVFNFSASTKSMSQLGNLQNTFSGPPRCNRRPRNKNIYRTPILTWKSANMISSFAGLNGANRISGFNSFFASTPPWLHNVTLRGTFSTSHFIAKQQRKMRVSVVHGAIVIHQQSMVPLDNAQTNFPGALVRIFG